MRCDAWMICGLAALVGCSEATSSPEDGSPPDAEPRDAKPADAAGAADAADDGGVDAPADAGPGMRLLRLRIVRDVVLAVPEAPVSDGRAMLVLADGTVREAAADASGEVTFRVPESEPFTVVGYVTEPEHRLAGFVGFTAEQLLETVEGSYLAGDDGVPLLRAAPRHERVDIWGRVPEAAAGGELRLAFGGGLAFWWTSGADWRGDVRRGVPATVVASYAEPDGTPTSPRGTALRTVGWDVVELPPLETSTEVEIVIDPAVDAARGSGSIPVPTGSTFLDEGRIRISLVGLDTGLMYGFADRVDVTSDGESMRYELEWIDVGASRSMTRFALGSEAGITTYWADGLALGEQPDVRFLDLAELVPPAGGWPVSWEQGLELAEPPPDGVYVTALHSNVPVGRAEVLYPPGTTELEPPPLPLGMSFEDFFGDGSSARVGLCDDPIPVRCRRAARAVGVEVVP